MKNISVLMLMILLSGCASYKVFTADAVVSGNNFITPAGGPVSGQIKYHTVTCIGKCPILDLSTLKEMGNADTGSTVITSR